MCVTLSTSMTRRWPITARFSCSAHCRNDVANSAWRRRFTSSLTSSTSRRAALVFYRPQHTHTRLTAIFPGLPRWAGTRKAKPIWILLKQETVSGSGISWNICKSAPRSRQITMPAPNHSVFYRPDALPAAQPTASNHWRHSIDHNTLCQYTHTHTHTHTQPFNGLWSGTSRVGQYQKKHSPTQTHPDHWTPFINFLHLLRSIASSLFNLRVWQSFTTTSLQVLLKSAYERNEKTA